MVRMSLIIAVPLAVVIADLLIEVIVSRSEFSELWLVLRVDIGGAIAVFRALPAVRSLNGVRRVVSLQDAYRFLVNQYC